MAATDAPDARPPEVLVDGELTVRRYTVADAGALDAAITASVEHLLPFMPWAAFEPLPLDARVELLRGWDDQWEERSNFNYGMFVGSDLVGGCGLKTTIGPTGMEIGYWVHVDHAGRGIATRASRLLTTAAFTVDGIDHVEIHHDTANLASGRVPAKLGYTAMGDVDDEISAPGDCGISRVWRVTRDEWTSGAR